MHFHLKSRALLKISGSDAESFLQAQLSNDIHSLNQKKVQINAYCQHQGKIIALLWVVRSNDHFFLSFPIGLLDVLKVRLQMFVIMSDVVIEDITEVYYQIGIINKTEPGAYKINDSQWLVLSESISEFDQKIEPNDFWHKICIDNNLPEVFLETSEMLVPQMLNLDINEIGVNFSKGCYPGQEVVARLHYLGKAKRRLYTFMSDSEMKVGDAVISEASKSSKASGLIINTVKYKSNFYCLATLEVAFKDQKVTLKDENGPTLKRINNE